MDVPFEVKHINTLISEVFADVDIDTDCHVRTVVPSRTFLEKSFLLNEELQKDAPRSSRMSRHLYDLERLMDTPFAKDALADKVLYEMVVEHRRKFYHAGYADYDMDYPQHINYSTSFSPTRLEKRLYQVGAQFRLRQSPRLRYVIATYGGIAPKI